MNEIVIIQDLSPSKLSKLYSYCIENDLEGEVGLVLPSKLKRYTFGLLGELLRFVINLNNKYEILQLKVEIDINNQLELDDLYSQEYTYPIVSLLWNKVSFIDKNGERIKSELRNKQNDFFVTMNSLSKIKGNKYILSSTDHLSRNNGSIKLFENSNGFNDDEFQIEFGIREILVNNVLTFNRNNLKEINGITNDIGAIIYELVKNTYEWGKTDLNNVALKSSIRGVYFRFHKNKLDSLTNEYKNTPLEDFFTHPSISDKIVHNSFDNSKHVYFLEILVFDSGCGFIEKFQTKDDLSDIDIIKKCLVKNQTSSISNLKSKKGIGLDRILKILDNKGFFRLYTDRYHVYRDLTIDRYKPINSNSLEDLVLLDWTKNEFKDKDNFKSNGSFISILYPFKSNI